MGIVKLNTFPDVEKVYNYSDRQLLEYIFPINTNIDSYGDWYKTVARSLSTPTKHTSPTKIRHICQGENKKGFSAIERIALEDIARKKIQTEKEHDNVYQLSLRLKGAG